MMGARTDVQREANRLDEQVYRVIDGMRFLAGMVRDHRAEQLRTTAAHLAASRHIVRELMHRDDRDATT